MESVLGNLPSYDPYNFSLLRPSDPPTSSNSTPPTYHPTHDTLPPPDQVIGTEPNNILLRQIYQHAEEKKLRPKRAASDNLTPEHGCKQPRISS